MPCGSPPTSRHGHRPDSRTAAHALGGPAQHPRAQQDTPTQRGPGGEEARRCRMEPPRQASGMPRSTNWEQTPL